MDFQDMDMGLAISLVALLVGGLAGIIGMWVERDDERPMKIFAALVLLCVLTTVVSMWQSIEDARDAAKQEEALANMLQKLDFIMQKSGVDVPELNDLVKSELSDASRNNPGLVKKVARRVADSGGNPAAVLGSYLPPDQMKRMEQSGNIAINSALSNAATAEQRKPLQFGGGPTQVRTGDTTQPLEAVKSAAAAPPPPPAPTSPSAEPSAAPSPSAPPLTTSAPAPQRKPAVTKPSAARDDNDIYDEAEADLRRK